MPSYTHRPATNRGRGSHGWLEARHSFSFAGYIDPAWMGFHALRVINEDRVQGGTGFGEHGHQHMEIITYVLSGQLEHRDSTGGHEIIEHGRIQVMSAGHAIRHSEMNPQPDAETHLLQCWIEPNSQDVEPGYQMADVAVTTPSESLQLLARPAGTTGDGIPIHADARVWAGNIPARCAIDHFLIDYPNAWIQVAHGELSVDGHRLAAGDGLAIEDAEQLSLVSGADGAEFLLFELA